MQNHFSLILKHEAPKSLIDRGPLLHSSSVIMPNTHQKVKAAIHSKMIVIDNDYIPLAFENRFCLQQKGVQFSNQDQTLLLELPEEDQLEWKEILKNCLNQKGFHQQFKPIKKIGKGNFASVYLVEKIDDHCHYAVKAFSKEAAYSEENGKECLIKEIEIMRQLDHKNTMKLYEVYESDNSLYLVFELIQGGSLHEKIKAKYNFKAEDVQHIVKGLLQGLKEMHSKKIMHRDLKPQNILLRKKDSLDCVIADFGLAEFSDSFMYLFTRCGTPGFVAPEVINIKDMKAKYSPICDIFSLGLIFYMLLFGKSLFKSRNYNDLVKENRESHFDFTQKQFQSVEKQTKDLLMKMLRVDPEERITAQQALAHPYFRLSLEEEERDSQEEKDQVSLQLTSSSSNNTPNLSTIQKNFRVKKDSCIDFKLPKESIFTGKTQTVEHVASTKVSMGNNMGKGIVPSKFASRQKENKKVSST